jgi:hypothetical protein
MKRTPIALTYDDEREMFHEVMNNENIMNEIRKNIVTDGTILEDLHNVNLLDKNSEEYYQLRDKVINVGEYKN